MSTRIGSSEKYLRIDLSAASFPLTFEAAFRAAYPNTGRRDFSSRAIVSLDGPGTLTLLDAEGHEVDWPMQAYESNEIVAVGVAAAEDISEIKVFL